jgi:hypothetical protein
LLAELKDVLWRPKFAKQLAARGLSPQDMFDGYAALATLVKACRYHIDYRARSG